MAVDEASEQNEVDEDTQCGLGAWRPAWLQRCLSTKAYVLVHGITGLTYFALSCYFTATITTMEKRFKIDSRTSGFIACAWDVGTFVSVLAMGYVGMRGHKTRLVAAGALLVAFSCFVRMLPHLLYGPGQDALELTKEFGDGGGGSASLGNTTAGSVTASQLCGAAAEDGNCQESGVTSSLPAFLMWLAQFIHGVGCSVYYTLGLTYLDDNTTKNKAPIAHASSHFIRLLGPTVGFTLASYTLSLYVDPHLTPRIDNTDPRWIGAWWIGWPPLGCMVVVFGCITILFPRTLPRAAARRAERIRKNIIGASTLPTGFVQSFRHLLRNKILVYNTLSAVCFIFGNTGYWIFMPKYMETMYHQSSSRASLISGSIGLASAGLGLMASAYVISRFKPRPRLVAGWNVIVEVADAFCKLGWIFLDCGDRRLQGSWEPNGTWNLTAECNADCSCGANVKYWPVCSLEGDSSFYSPCHAGCNSSMEFSNGTKIFGNCSCIPSGVAVDGPCAMDCVTNFTIFLLSQCIMSFLSSSGRAGNILIQFRCVHEDEKSLSIAFSEFLMCGLAFIPAPIIIGSLVDSTCLVWGETCGKRGNCWLYNDWNMRYLLNLTAICLTLAGVCLDAGVCYYAKGLKIYDEDDEKAAADSNGPVNTEAS